MDPVFSCADTFARRFERGLADILGDGSLGGFILACANAAFDRRLLEQMREPLQAQLCLRAAALENGLEDASEDAQVLRRMCALGADALEPTRVRRAGPWELQFNRLRSLRPSRMANRKVTRIHAAFDAERFNFNKAFLQKEAFWGGTLLGRSVDLYYNKFPFVDLHALLVPERRAGYPQFLGSELHVYVWSLAEALGETLPGVGFGYNSLGAFASVNHLHFQMFVRDGGLPVCDPHWRHNGGSRPYPARCHVFDDMAEAWGLLQTLHATDSAYNLVYTPGRLYCFPRRLQGSYEPAPWSSGHSWYELAGGVITADAADFSRLSEADISAELSRISLPE